MNEAPNFCPFCGAQSGLRSVTLWDAASQDDPIHSDTVLEEYQCLGCGNMSFWVGAVDLEVGS